MGTIILILALFFEVIFAAYCIATRSSQFQVRSYLRISAFAAFVLFTLIAIIQWSFRWYGLATLLLVLAALGVWALVRKKVEKKQFSAGRTVLLSIAMLLLIFVAVVPALIFPQYTPPKVTGLHAVATVNYTYTDPARIETFTNTGENRKVNMECWYPKDDHGKYPLVVFSHGAFGIKTSNTSTFLELASNGYVVCSLDHPYHSLFTFDADGHRTMVDQSFLQEVVDLNNGKYDEATGFKLHKEWMNLRIADIQFMLDTILAQVHDNPSDAMYQRIDPTKIGLMGHSLGGESSAQVARLRNDIGAVVNLDSNMEGEYLDYINGKYVMNVSVYPVPLLNILTDTTERMIDAVLNANTVVAVKRVTATAPNAYQVNLKGTDHMSVTDLPLVSPFLVSIINAEVPKGGGQETDPLATVEKMNELVLKFFNTYLKGEGNFDAETQT